jgi:hypothetical protein
VRKPTLASLGQAIRVIAFRRGSRYRVRSMVGAGRKGGRSASLAKRIRSWAARCSTPRNARSEGKVARCLGGQIGRGVDHAHECRTVEARQHVARQGAARLGPALRFRPGVDPAVGLVEADLLSHRQAAGEAAQLSPRPVAQLVWPGRTP